MKSIQWFMSISTLLFIVGCHFNQKKTNNLHNNLSEKKQNTELEINYIQKKDTLLLKNQLSKELLYSEWTKKDEEISRIKFNPTTLKRVFTYFVNGDSVEITLFHVKDRIARIEKRTFANKTEIKIDSYDFSESNECLSSLEWLKQNKMSFINAFYQDTLLRFDVHFKMIDITSYQKKQIIKNTKSSLDSIMQHFPEFKYSINWK